MTKVGTFTERARENGMTAPEYAVHLVKKHGTINGAAREALCNRQTIRYHLNAIGAVVTPAVHIAIPNEVSA